MGNEFTKHFRSDDGYELSFTVKKPPGAPPLADQNGNASGYTGTENETENEVEEQPRPKSGRKRGEPASPLLGSSSPKVQKNSVGRPKKVAVDSSGAPATPAAVGAAVSGDETPRGRRSTCITVSDTPHPSMTIQIIKSHLSPNYMVTLPAEFVKKHLSDLQTYDIIDGGSLKVIKHSPSRFTLEKKFWAALVQEKKLELKDTVHLELVGENRFRVDIFRAPPEAAAEEGAEQDVKTGEATSAPADQEQNISTNLADAQQC